VFVTCRELK